MKQNAMKASEMTMPTENLIDFLCRQEVTENPLNLGMLAGEFLKTQFPECEIWLFGQETFLREFELDGASSRPGFVPDLLAMFPAGWVKENKDVFAVGDKWVIPLREKGNTVLSLLVISGLDEGENSKIGLIAAEIQRTFSFASMVRQGIAETVQGKSANIVSQMAHDMQSLINLATSKMATADLLAAKVKYIDRLSREITFYMRDIQLLKTVVGGNDLISAVLSEITPPEGVILNFAPSENFSIRVDVELIDKAISEVIRNAIMASSPNGGEIKIRMTEKKHFTPLLGRRGIEISIEDSGPGIPRDFEHLIKNPFFTTWKERGGLGLGLSNADKIITAHGGRMQIENRDGNGVNVLIYLPMEEE